jgi:hypothetical protein
MLKKRASKIIVGAILVISALMMSNTASASSATCADMTGDYIVAGSLKLTVNLTGFVSASITLPKLENLQAVMPEYFHFNSNHTLSDDLLSEIFNGAAFATWSQNGCSFTVNYTDFANTMLALLTESNIDADIVSPTTLTGKISSKDGTNSGTLNLKINLNSPITGSLTVAMKFKGYPADALSAAKNLSETPGIKNFLSDILSKIRKQSGQVAP